MYIDSHAHLDGERFDEDRDQLIGALALNDIELFINPGADMESSQRAVALSKKYPHVYAAVGVHPHDVDNMTKADMEKLEDWAKEEKVVAIGEIGLDYYYDLSDREVQKQKFREQIRLAKKMDLPIIVHSRDADTDTFDIIKDEQDGSLRGVMHCFTGDFELAKQYIDLGLYISISGMVTFKNAEKTREVAQKIDIDKLLIETDSPYLTPVPHRGKRNNPMYVKYVAEIISELRDMNIKELGNITSENTKSLFRI